MNAVDTMLVELKIPRKPEFVRLARATAWALAAQLDFHITHAEDIKLAVSEACTNAVEHVNDEHCDEVVIRFVVDPERFTVEVVDDGPGFDVAQLERCEEDTGGLGLAIMRSVMDEVDVICDPKTGTCVRMTKFRNQREL